MRGSDWRGRFTPAATSGEGRWARAIDRPLTGYSNGRGRSCREREAGERVPQCAGRPVLYSTEFDIKLGRSWK
jgi:hypothetical protein